MLSSCHLLSLVGNKSLNHSPIHRHTGCSAWCQRVLPNQGSWNTRKYISYTINKTKCSDFFSLLKICAYQVSPISWTVFPRRHSAMERKVLVFFRDTPNIGPTPEQTINNWISSFFGRFKISHLVGQGPGESIKYFNPDLLPHSCCFPTFSQSNKPIEHQQP